MHPHLIHLNHRYATKQFDTTKKLSAETLEVIEESLRLTPSSLGIQPWKFVIIQDHATREKLLERSTMNQSQITTCSHLVVLCGLLDVDDNYINNYVAYALEQWGDPERLGKYQAMLKERMHSYREAGTMKMYIHNQVYIALGNLITTCATLEIDACPMGGFLPHVYNEDLGLTEQDYESIVLCALGYRSADDKMASRPKVRWNKERVITHL